MKHEAKIEGPIPEYLVPPEVSAKPIASDEEGDAQFTDGINALVNAFNWALYAQQCFMRCSDYAQHIRSANMAAAMAQAVTASALGAEALESIMNRYLPDEIKNMSREEQVNLAATMRRNKAQA